MKKKFNLLKSTIHSEGPLGRFGICSGSIWCRFELDLVTLAQAWLKYKQGAPATFSQVDDDDEDDDDLLFRSE